MKRFDRILKIFFLLQSRSVLSNEELQEHFGIGRRTIYRDLQSLAEAGVPVVNEHGEGYSLMEGFRVHPPRFTQEEMMGLLIAEKTMQQHETVLIRQHFAAAMIKIKSGFLRHQKSELLQLEQNLTFNQLLKPGNYLPNILDALVNSILAKKTIVIAYLKLNETRPESRTIEPVGIYFHHFYWYVMAYCHLRQDYRIFRLDRIQKITLLDKGFTRKHPPLAELRAKASLSNTTSITIAVQHQFAHFLFAEKQLYGFTNEKLEGDEVHMFFECNHHPVTFARWLLKFVDIARVIEPKAVQEEVIRILNAGIRNNGLVS